VSTKPGLKHLGGLTIGLYLAGAVAVGVAGWQVWGESRHLSEWPEIQATVKGRRVIGDPDGYRGEVDFAYAEQGIKYVSSARDAVVVGKPSQALERLEQWPVGSQRTVRYNPQDPSEVDMDAREAFARFVWPAALALLGIGLIVVAGVRTSERFDEIRAASAEPEPLPMGGPLPDMDWIARATEAAEKRRQEAIVAKKSNAKLRKEVRRVRIGAAAVGVTGLLLCGAAYLVARPQMALRSEWRKMDASSVGVSIVDVERKGKTLYSVDALMAVEKSATGSAVLVSAGDWYSDRAKAEADSAKVDYGTAQPVIVDPKDEFRARLAASLHWTDFLWTIAFALMGLAALGSAAYLVREAQEIQTVGMRKVRALAPKTHMPTPPRPIDLDFPDDPPQH
jgi:hypothetical protein